MILNENLKPCNRLIEDTLAKELGISRTLIRQVVRKLASEALVYISPKRCTRVSEHTVRDVDEIYEIREALESLAAKKVARRITEKETGALKKLVTMAEQTSLTNDSVKIARISKRFDSIVCKASGNTKLLNLIDIVYTSGAIHREIILKSPGAFEESIKIRKAVIDVLEKKDGKATEKAVRSYIRKGKERILTHE